METSHYTVEFPDPIRPFFADYMQNQADKGGYLNTPDYSFGGQGQRPVPRPKIQGGQNRQREEKNKKPFFPPNWLPKIKPPVKRPPSVQ